MIHTYKRKRTSLKARSFYERLCGDPLAECLPITSPIEKNILHDCCSRDAKEVKLNGWSRDELSDNSNILQSLHRESYEPHPIKFTYVRRCKSLSSNTTSMQYVERMTQVNALQPVIDKTDCISFQCKLPAVDPNQDIPSQDTGCCSYDSLSEKQYDISDKPLGPLENPGSLCCDPYSQNCYNNVAKEYEARRVHSVSPDIDRCTGGSDSIKVSDKRENAMSQKKSDSKDLDGSGTDDSNFENLHKGVETKFIAPLLTYNRRSRKGEYSSRTYVDLSAERENYESCDQILIESAGSHTNYDEPKIVDRGNPENVVGREATFSPPLEKLTEGISAIGAVISGQENQKERNDCQLMYDVKASEVTSLNNDVETGQQSDDAMKSHCKICDLSNKGSLTSTEMGNSFKTGLENSQKQERAAVASQHFSDKPDKVALNLVANTECLGVGLSLQPKAFQLLVERKTDASLSAKAQRSDTEELIETMNIGVTRNLNAQPCDSGVISQNSKVLYSVALPQVSTNSKVLQLFPEGSTCPSIGTSNSGSAPAVISNDSSAILAQPDSSTGPRESIQNKMFEPSSCQKRPKLLLDSMRSSRRPQMTDTEAFRQNFPAFASYWSEEELDNLWVGVRRHGKDNWYLMLKDPKLRFSPWRTERDLAEKWIMEQTKLLGNSTSSQCEHTNPLAIPMPPRPGSMTRVLTDPTQLSVCNPYLNNQGPMALNNAPGNGTGLLNRRVRANKRSKTLGKLMGKIQNKK